jgi:hypothetical protein
MKAFSDEFVRKLNARSEAGTFLKAIEVTEDADTPIIRRYVDFEREITYGGNTYKRLPMAWSGLEIQPGMQLPTMDVTVPSVPMEREDGEIHSVSEWIELLDLLEHDVRLLILHLDLLDDSTAKDQVLLQIQTVQDDPAAGACVIRLGLNLDLTDMLPRGVITKAEFPGIPDDRVRIQI